MVGDQLSEVFDLVEIRGQMTGGFIVSGPWSARSPAGIPLKYVALVRGRALLYAEALDGPLELSSGDVVILREQSAVRAEGGHGDGPRREVDARDQFLDLSGPDDQEADVVVGGRIDLDDAGRAVLLAALPAVSVIRASAPDASDLHTSLQRLVTEATTPRMGSAFALRQCAQLVVLDVLRACLVHSDLPPGLLRLLADERLRPALEMMHSDPARAWHLADLAHAAAMSRTSFAERFRAVAGMPPLTYLTQWRMALARRDLRRPGSRVRPIALGLGYGSESAFSAAFTRETGESPQAYRRRALTTAAG